MNRLLRVTVFAVILSAALFILLKSNAEAAGTAVLNEARVRQIVTDYLLEKTKDLGLDIQLKKLSFSGEVILPAGNSSFEVVSPQEWEGWGRASLALIVRVDDRVVKNIPLNVEVEALADVVVAVRAMERGMILDKGNVALQKRDMATLPGRTCRNLEEVVGKQVRVGMRGNSPIRSDYLERLPLVKRGQLVTIIAENDKFRITSSGKVKGNGAEGDTVQVQGLNAQKDITAVVVDASTVRVEF
jgi:flagellar basal body P-ring formation protein FlgA